MKMVLFWRTVLFLIAGAAVATNASGGETVLPLATSNVPKDFVVIGTRPNMGELWATKVSAPNEPTFCVKDGHVVCVLYGITKQMTDLNSSWANFYGLKGLPPVTDMRVEYEAEWGGQAIPRFNIVLYFIDK